MFLSYLATMTLGAIARCTSNDIEYQLVILLSDCGHTEPRGSNFENFSNFKIFKIINRKNSGVRIKAFEFFRPYKVL